MHLPRWAIPFAQPAPYKSARGGRTSSKTRTFSSLIIARCTTTPTRVMCCREFQSSINVSAKHELEAEIHRKGLSQYWKIQDQRLLCSNGSVIMFRGLERNREEIRGWANINIIWVEEAQRLSHASAGVLVPTIQRNPGVEMWFSWNPTNRTDWVWERFVQNPRPTDVSAIVNWRENPWFPPEAEVERLADMKSNPSLYDHIWEGQPDDEATAQKVLPYPLLSLCLEAFDAGHAEFWTKEGNERQPDLGLDVADRGTNFNALVTRIGPLITDARKWRSNIIGETARRADRIAREVNANRVFYDAGGVGAGVRSYFSEMDDRPYFTRPEQFGGAIKGPKTTYSYRLSNEQMFARRNAQLGWNLRVRAENTQRLMNGEEVLKERCLFIDSSIPDLNAFLAQLSQPEWRENEVTGKTELMKRDEDEPSPDMYDAAVLAFAKDTENGLKRRYDLND